MYNKQRNSNNAQTYESIPLKIKQTPHLNITGSRKLVPVPLDNINPSLNAYRKDSQRYTCYQTYPQHEQDRDYQRDSVVGLETSSVCPSIQNGMFQTMLLDLHEEIKLKSDAFAVAEAIVRKQEDNIKTLTQQNKNLKQKLDLANTKIRNLQEQLNMKTQRYDESTTKKSITKTYITQKNIPNDEQPQPLKLISAQIFNDFAQNYQVLLNELSNWVCKQQQEQLDNSIFNKLHMHKLEVEELLFGKCEQQCSKTTFETLFDNIGSQEKKKIIPGCSAYNQYEQTIDMYKQYCNKLSSQLCESINYILQLSKSLQKAHSIYTQMSKPKTLLPTELMTIITKQCNKIINGRFTELKNENLELINIIEEMIGWIEKNSKDGGQKFRSSFSAMY